MDIKTKMKLYDIILQFMNLIRPERFPSFLHNYLNIITDIEINDIFISSIKIYNVLAYRLMFCVENIVNYINSENSLKNSIISMKIIPVFYI